MKSFVFCLVILSDILAVLSSNKCVPRSYGTDKQVCVCNETYCDTIDPVKRAPHGSFLKYTSNKEGLRFEEETGKFLETADSKNKITINHERIYQEIKGFGGAFTDATCINILSLNGSVRSKLLTSYFSEEGIEYNIGRIPMAATDFSTHPYTYHDEEDVELRNFTLAPEDHNLRLPILKLARELTKHNLIFFASTWIAPNWMMTNGNYTGGMLKKNLYQVWANYFLKFLDAYKEEGIDFWGITTGNEPTSGFIPGVEIPNVAWTSHMQRDWIRDNLGPTLRKSSHFRIKILMLDDQRVFLSSFMDDILIDERANSYVDGVALHWYLDRYVPAYLITTMQMIYPTKFFIGTEATAGAFTPQPVKLGDWGRADEYAFSIIEDMNNWVTGWMDWNMAVDLQGGPTFISNFCDSPILVNASAQEFLKQPMYYAIGHFSKFVPRGSRRIYTSISDGDAPHVAFRRPDGGVVLVILNSNETSVNAVVQDRFRGHLNLTLTANSITTIVYW